MGKILRRKILTEDTLTSISVDRETHDSVKYWAKKESISMAKAQRYHMESHFASCLAATSRQSPSTPSGVPPCYSRHGRGG